MLGKSKGHPAEEPNIGEHPMNKKYIDTGSARGAEILAQYLELCGYSYGYPVSGKCQRRSAGNMPFITIHEDLQLYNNKNTSTDVYWKKLSSGTKRRA